MRPGTKPKPTATKRAAGNPGRRPLNELEPRYASRRWYAPKWLTEEGKWLWRSLVGVLEPAGVLTEADLPALMLLCMRFETAVEANRERKKTGFTVEGSSGSPIVNPLERVVKGALGDVRWFLAEFGLTPSSRTRIKTESAEERSLAEILFDGVEVGREE